MKNLFHGVLLINKEAGCTSHDVVLALRKKFYQKEVGHAGTLDPSARGLLVILLGQATKLSSYILNNNKRYRVTMKYGLVTNTFDKEGEIIKETPVSLTKEEIQKNLNKHLGKQKFPVPIFSAVKVRGKKLYHYARSEQSVELPVREMSFFDLELKEVTKDTATVEISCAKGSYIRSWVHALGESLGTGACLIHLIRTHSEPFALSESLTLKELEEKITPPFPQNDQELKLRLGHSFLFCSEALPQFPCVQLNSRNSFLLSQGHIPAFLIQDTLERQKEVNRTQQNQIMRITEGSHLVSLLEFRPFQKLRILKNFSSSRR